MRYFLVNKEFKDKETKEIYGVNSVYSCNNEERITELFEKGYLEVELIIKEDVSKDKEKESKK